MPVLLDPAHQQILADGPRHYGSQRLLPSVALVLGWALVTVFLLGYVCASCRELATAVVLQVDGVPVTGQLTDYAPVPGDPSGEDGYLVSYTFTTHGQTRSGTLWANADEANALYGQLPKPAQFTVSSSFPSLYRLEGRPSELVPTLLLTLSVGVLALFLSGRVRDLARVMRLRRDGQVLVARLDRTDVEPGQRPRIHYSWSSRDGERSSSTVVNGPVLPNGTELWLLYASESNFALL